MSLPGPRTAHDWQAFSVSGIPVTFSAWYLLAVWAVFARASSLETGLWHLVAVTLSVLVHELGHAYAARHYRLNPKILLHGFGGYCEHGEAYRANDALVVTASGPAAGLALGILAYGAGALLNAPQWWVALLLSDLAWMGVVWTAVNLLPIMPLDGGSILLNLLVRRHGGPDPARIVQQVSVLTAIFAGIVALWQEQFGALILLALLGWDNAVALGWVPRIPGFSMGLRTAPTFDAPRSKRKRRAGWRLTPAFGAVLAVLTLPLAMYAASASPSEVWALQTAREFAAWQLVTWPMAPRVPPFGLASALLAVGLVGPSVEDALGTKRFLGLSAAILVVVGLVAAAIGQLAPLSPSLGGSAPLALGLLAVWAYVSRAESLGPNAIRAMNPPVILAIVLLFDVWLRFGNRDAMGGAADVVAVAMGLGTVAELPGPRRFWRRFQEWRLLRNPPALDFEEFRSRPGKRPQGRQKVPTVPR